MMTLLLTSDEGHIVYIGVSIPPPPKPPQKHHPLFLAKPTT